MNNLLWARNYWNFFHVLSVNINRTKINQNNVKILYYITRRLFMNIPCEKCMIDAVNYLDNSIYLRFTTNEEIIDFYYKFHNYVNLKLKKPTFYFHIVDQYKNLNYLIFLKNIDSILFKNKLDNIYYAFLKFITE